MNVAVKRRGVVLKVNLFGAVVLGVLTGLWSGDAGADVLYWPGVDADWETVTAAEAGADQAQLMDAVAYGASNLTHGTVVLWGGRILVEAYGPGTDRGTQGTLYSATKSVVGTLIGMAIEDGGITGVTQKTSDFLSEWAGVAGKEDLTIDHHLTMTTGIEGGMSNFMQSLPSDTNQRQFAAGLPLAHTPGTFWDYNEPAYQLLFSVIEEAEGVSLDTYTQTKLLGPLGMTNTSWVTMNSGPHMNYYWFKSSALDAARFGLLALRNGEWNGSPLVSTNWIQTSITPSQSLNPSYGRLWWLNGQDSHQVPFYYDQRNGGLFPDCPEDTFAALGASDNNIYVVPSLDLVVVRLGDNASGQGEVAISAFDNLFLAKFCKAFGYTPPTQTLYLGACITNETVEVTVPTWKSRLYTLETCENLVEGDWVGVTNMTDLEGDGLPIVYTNMPSAPQTFYRVLTWSALDD